MRDYTFYRKVLDYLYEKNMGFCFLESGELISREQCLDYIRNEKKELTMYDYAKLEGTL